ncbi:unnamed protein product [Blepharisma stoltei]|uniref:Serine/threonine-protein phosphatase n=1 Tax=Blepharisma stoltei TaxID=1481888 RepID=A0AAU9J254_9CILI|nr:unnamed protein product [Blepharisma stoltei]
MEALSDPLNNRAIKEIKPPPHRPLSTELLFPQNNNGKPSWKVLREHYQREGCLYKADVLKIVELAINILKDEPNLLALQDPVTIVGDIHGQYFDLLKMFSIGGNPETTKYLFLGDYVDRGSFSLEVIIYLFSLKINFPNTLFLIRGNHECRQMTSFFNFRQECLYKYDAEVYDWIMDSMDCLPLACIVNKKFLNVHGGLSPELRSIDDITRINRFIETPRHGAFCDLLWSDPIDHPEGRLIEGFRNNDVRGCSYFFGQEVTNKFLKDNEMISLIRAHEVQLDGYKMHRWNGTSEFPSVITIFSAPNYCDLYGNKAAIIKFDNNTLNIQQYNYTQHPYLLPNFMDVFEWSIPFVIEKVMEMLMTVIKIKPNDDIDNEYFESRLKELEESVRENRKTQLVNKVKSVSRMLKILKTVREEHETIIKLKGMCPDNKIPKDVIMAGQSALHNTVDNFTGIRSVDIVNEKRPE